MDYNNNKNENWDWQREEYGDQKDSRYDISKCMWNGVPQNEEDMSYMHVELRCTNCFSFLVPAGNWIRNIFAPESHTGQVSAIISPIVYPREDDPLVDFIAVHQSHGEQIFDFKDSGSEENTAKNHDSSSDFSFSPSKPKTFIDEDKNGSYSCLEKASTKEHEKDNLTNKSAEEATEIYLEKLYQKQGPHEFCCANCNSCITKVLIIRERYLEPAPTVALPDKEHFRCSSSFAFLIPAVSAETGPGNSFLIPMRTADESDGVSFIVGQISEVKELMKVLMKKFFRRLHPNKKAGRWNN